MSPAPGERFVRFVGDVLRFSLRAPNAGDSPNGFRALLRTNIGRAKLLRREIIEAHTHGLPLAGGSWRDLPMVATGDGWSIELPLAEPGYFKAKGYLVDADGWQSWPDGPDVGISVHPNAYRTGNTIYCAFTRLFGPTKKRAAPPAQELEKTLRSLEDLGYATLPKSGTLRDLTSELPHIIQTLGCRIVHLLPVNPTPTTYARFGRFGSPYAAIDLTAIDPALIVFDKKTTGVQQFCELAYATHALGARLFLDIVINHTGWGSTLQEDHPDWFVRSPDGAFASPGAWGNIWEDLVELKHQNVALWDKLASMFLTWCRRGVDGFRCDAGYKVPVAAWQYIVARVQEEYPNTIFLLEGLGGPWEATSALLTEGGMQWAYSELFQNYSPAEITPYLGHSFRESASTGLLVHYSETHDNDRLAKKGRAWSLLRNRLCALTSVSGGFGFTCGVEWLAQEKIDVHRSPTLDWGNRENIIPELARLNRLLLEHPCFFDSASVRILSTADSPVLALLRTSADNKDEVLVLVNTDPDKAQTVEISQLDQAASRFCEDLLGQKPPAAQSRDASASTFSLPAGSAFCLSPTKSPVGPGGAQYRRERAVAAWGLEALAAALPARSIPLLDWQWLARAVDDAPARFLAAATQSAQTQGSAITAEAFAELITENSYEPVIFWNALDARRISLVPAGHWLLLQLPWPFRASLHGGGELRENVESTETGHGHIAFFTPRNPASGQRRHSGPQQFSRSGRDELHLLPTFISVEQYGAPQSQLTGIIHFLPPEPEGFRAPLHPDQLVLLTNGRGGMARMCIDLGRIKSKYDCVLGANLHPSIPVDRHILAKRLRIWVNAEGFISPLDFRSLHAFTSGNNTATWDFIASAGDGRTVEIKMSAVMVAGQNTIQFNFSRPGEADATGKQLPAEASVRLTVRLDIEDRGFHSETKDNGGADNHFNSNMHPLDLPDGVAPPVVGAPVASPAATHESTMRAVLSAPLAGFAFTPASDRQLRVFSSSGTYHPAPEWSHNIPHPIEQSRGQEGFGDAFSPGWFDLPLPKGAEASLTVTAELENHPITHNTASVANPSIPPLAKNFGVNPQPSTAFEDLLLEAIKAFVVRRGEGKTVIAGYPWFLDWGRDTFICARGLLAAGMVDEVKQILITFARFHDRGTLPNTIFGDDASNRDTSDAPLWFAIVCEELAELEGYAVYQTKVGRGNQTLADTLYDIALNYINGTPNGIRMDPGSGLIWSPPHFTWMDTNYPAATPRQGYPIEIQALWIRLLRQLEIVGGRTERTGWNKLAQQALDSVEKLFWSEPKGWYGDVLSCAAGTPAASATLDDCLRSNAIFLVSLGLATGLRAQQTVSATARYLVVPGALRSLAPLPVTVPLPICANHGALLNDPLNPYWPRYEGDEDNRRKPAYHNGTAWVWTFPSFCEALARAWDFSPAACAAAKSYLASTEPLLNQGCLGQLPEILDGDAPHTPRGCDAQAWSVTETLRVLKKL